MKKSLLILFGAALVSVSAMAQPPKPPPAPIPVENRNVLTDLKTQGEHVKSSGNDLLHLRFKKAHEKHVAEMKRKNDGIAKVLGIKVQAPPPPPKVIVH